MIVSRWKVQGLYKADAQKVADEILTLGDSVEPSAVVEKAKDEKTELHKCFEWRDDVAAEKYRLHQARHLMCNLVIEKVEGQAVQEPVRLMFKTKADEGYKPINIIMQEPDEYKALLNRAYRELARFKQKYKILKELKDIFELIP